VYLVDNVFLKLVIKNVEERKKEGERQLQISDFLSVSDSNTDREICFKQ